MLRSLCKVHRWWMSFLPYRSSALMIPPPPSVTQRIRLESFNPRSNSSSNSSQISWFSVAPSQKPRGSFFLHGPRRARPRTPDRRGGPCLGTREERKLFETAPGTASAASPSPRPDGGDTELGVTPKALPAAVTVSSYLRADMKHLRQEFLRKAPAILELLVGSQPDLTLRAAIEGARQGASGHRHRSTHVLAHLRSPDDVGW